MSVVTIEQKHSHGNIWILFLLGINPLVACAARRRCVSAPLRRREHSAPYLSARPYSFSISRRAVLSPAGAQCVHSASVGGNCTLLSAVVGFSDLRLRSFDKLTAPCLSDHRLRSFPEFRLLLLFSNCYFV